MASSSGSPAAAEHQATAQPAPDADAAAQLLLQISFAVMAVIIAVGSIGNSIVLYVYSRKKDRQTANTFIISLAVTDTVACTLVIPMTVGMEIVRFRANLFVCKLYYLVNASGIPFSCMLMTAIAVDRYFCICRPFLRAITIPRARAIVLVLGSVAVTLGITTATFCSGVVAEVGPNGSWQYASYGYCKEINDIKSLNDTNLNISDASLAFYNVFQKVHLSLFGICIAVVFVLYIGIYRSVLAMRRKRRELKGQRPSRQSRGGGEGGGGGGSRKVLEVSEMQDRVPPPDVVASAAAAVTVTEVSAMAATGDGGGRDGGGVGVGGSVRTRFAEPSEKAEAAASATAEDGAAARPDSSASTQLLKKRRKSLKLAKDSDALQNLKTAAMLFVVTIVFVCTFVPAALMLLKLMDFNILIFYLYYLTHATNPLIYCFMNQNFRDDLRRIFCHGRRRSGGVGGGAGTSGIGASSVGGAGSLRFQATTGSTGGGQR